MNHMPNLLAQHSFQHDMWKTLPAILWRINLTKRVTQIFNTSEHQHTVHKMKCTTYGLFLMKEQMCWITVISTQICLIITYGDTWKKYMNKKIKNDFLKFMEIKTACVTDGTHTKTENLWKFATGPAGTLCKHHVSHARCLLHILSSQTSSTMPYGNWCHCSLILHSLTRILVGCDGTNMTSYTPPQRKDTQFRSVDLRSKSTSMCPRIRC